MLKSVCIKLQPFSQNDEGNNFLFNFLIHVITFDGIEKAFYKMLSHPSSKNLNRKNPKQKSSTENSKFPVLKGNFLNC